MYYDESGSVSPEPTGPIGDLARGVEGFVGAAGTGFALSATGGEAMLNAVKIFRDALTLHQRATQDLKQAPKLGNTPGALRVAPHIQRSAESLDEVVRGMSRLMDDLETGIKKAMASYKSTDGAGAQNVKGASSG